MAAGARACSNCGVRKLLLLPLLVLLLAPAPADAAYTARCIPGDASSPTCTWWEGRVTFVSDGDTVDVRIRGQGERQIRFTGINAMELQRYSSNPSKRRGDCHAREAAALVERHVKQSRFRVRLAAQKASSRSGRRLRRSVWVRSGGRWQDLARLELAAGHALWLPNGDEWAHNRDYAELAARAVAARRNLYDSDACGIGPDDDLPVTLAVNWDADGSDDGNLNGEWVDIRNGGRRPLRLAGWFFRDSSLRPSTKRRPPGYEFPASAVVPAGGSVRLRMGCGTDTARELHWCQDGTVFENVTGGPRHVGDGGYLFDPQRDLRASFLYPCLVACVDTAAGRVRIDARPSRPEAMTIVNTSSAPVELSDHVLKLRNHGRAGEFVFGHIFPPGTVIAAGDSLRYEHPTDNRFSDNGGVVELRTLDDSLTACADWGFGRC
jgi:endonuclease YncB( thermonuclease family)